MRVVLTRAQEDAERSAAALTARGYEVALAPVLEIAPTGPALDAAGHDALIVTSAHAFAGWGARLEDERDDALRLPLYAVGGRTAQAARRAGFKDVRIAPEGDAASLVDLIRLTAPPGARLLHLAGRDRKSLIEQELSKAFRLDAVIVYEARAAALPPRGMAALRQGRAVALHYSARSARLFLELAAQAGLDPRRPDLLHGVLSEDVAQPLREAGAQVAFTADRPDEASLFEALGKACPPST